MFSILAMELLILFPNGVWRNIKVCTKGDPEIISASRQCNEK